MATLAEIFDFETPVEAAARAALHTQSGIQARVSRSQGLSPHQMVYAKLALGEPLNQHYPVSDVLWVESAYNATLTFYVRTLRQSEDAAFPSDLHASLRAQLRVFMLDGIAQINAGLSLHELSGESTPGATSAEYSDDRFDITELPYAVTLSVKPAAWPVS